MPVRSCSTHPSWLTWFTGLLAGIKAGAVQSILAGTVKRVKAPSISIILMVCMAVVMENSGMTEALAHGLARFAGVFFPLVAPWIGALGAFMTGSNTNSNVVFALLQLRTRRSAGLPGCDHPGWPNRGGGSGKRGGTCQDRRWDEHS